jgi:hypothetical protein
MKADILRRLAEGQGLREASRETGIAYTTLRRNFSDQVPKVKEVGMALAHAEMNLAQLPISAQKAARTLADQLKGISANLARAAAAGSDTAARLTEAANRKAAKIDPETLENMEHLPTIAALTEVANKAAAPALSLMAANAKTQTSEAASPEALILLKRPDGKD